MEVLFSNQFLKQLQKLNDKVLAKNIETVIVNVKNASRLSEINNLKKLQGSSNAYSIRIGDFRIGCYYAVGSFEFICLMHRKEIYKFFP